jgi:hypothetical protein
VGIGKNGWGKVCTKGGYMPPPITTVYTTAPPPKYAKKGETSDPYGLACLDKSTCVEPTCTAAPTTTPATIAKCPAVGEEYNDTNMKCCERIECKKNEYGYDSSYVAGEE